MFVPAASTTVASSTVETSSSYCDILRAITRYFHELSVERGQKVVLHDAKQKIWNWKNDEYYSSRINEETNKNYKYRGVGEINNMFTERVDMTEFLQQRRAALEQSESQSAPNYKLSLVPPDHNLRVTVIGDAAVGKTSLIMSFLTAKNCKSVDYVPTVYNEGQYVLFVCIIINVRSLIVLL